MINVDSITLSFHIPLVAQPRMPRIVVLILDFVLIRLKKQIVSLHLVVPEETTYIFTFFYLCSAAGNYSWFFKRKQFTVSSQLTSKFTQH